MKPTVEYLSEADYECWRDTNGATRDRDIIVVDEEGIAYLADMEGGFEFQGNARREVETFLDPSIPTEEGMKVGDRLRLTGSSADIFGLVGKTLRIVSVDHAGPFPVIGQWDHLRWQHPGRLCHLTGSMYSSTGVRCWERVK